MVAIAIASSLLAGGLISLPAFKTNSNAIPCKPDLFKGIKREIALTDLLQFDSLGAVKLDMLEKEIETFRRESYIVQFSELEKKFDIRTLRDFPEWPTFVEMAQRRNLMTHNDGCVSQQYVIQCEREGYVFQSKPKIGEKLELSRDYLRNALLTVSKVGFMLSHTLWRKVLPRDIAKSDEAMNSEIYDLLSRKRWIAASEFGMFGLSQQMIRNSAEMDKRIRTVNTAIALKQTNRKADALRLMDQVDWSASLREFRLARAVLEDDFPEAARIMREIGKEGEMVQQLCYHTWPLFENFRECLEFHEAYKEIYGVPFIEKASKDAKAQAAKLGENVSNATQDYVSTQQVQSPTGSIPNNTKRTKRKQTAMPKKKPQKKPQK